MVQEECVWNCAALQSGTGLSLVMLGVSVLRAVKCSESHSSLNAEGLISSVDW